MGWRDFQFLIRWQPKRRLNLKIDEFGVHDDSATKFKREKEAAMSKLIKILLISFVLICMSFYTVFAGEQEKDIIKALERVSSLLDNVETPEFRRTFSDCQSEIKMAKMIETNYPKFTKIAEETFNFFKAVKGRTEALSAMSEYYELLWEHEKPNEAEYKEYFQREDDYKKYIEVNKKAGRRRLEDLYKVFNEEVFKK